MPRGDRWGLRRLRVRWPYVILGLLLILFAVKFVEKTRELQQLNQQAAALQLANQQTMADNTRLQHAIRYYRTTAYVEARARSVFGLTLPGEVPVVVTSPSHPRYTAAPAVIRRVASSPPPWRQWWRSFFG
ncbi:MAG TPA: septum formation initiator family protein [Chloroflexota bacterium]|nr:septum formation initiator family protein [Chloroflexota bacterium]